MKVCDKKCFKSTKAAKKNIGSGVTVGQRMRVYFCKDCLAYHTTKTQKRGLKDW